MTTTDAIEGTVNDVLWYHYDIPDDVLYLRFVSTQDQEVYGEETPDGFILMRTADDQIAGMAIISWWKRFGKGNIGKVTLDSLQNQVANMAHRLAA